MSFCINATRCVGRLSLFNSWLMDEICKDDKRNNISNFYQPAETLNRKGEYLMSGTTSQIFNLLGLGSSQAVYVIKPKNYDPEQSYPVVFFMHGLLGNWKLYQGIFRDLDDCIVVSVGTNDLSGIYTKSDINSLFTKQIPFLRNLGFKVDERNIHAIGLSNGGSASNVAYNSFSDKFKSITFISTGIQQTYPIKSKVLLIGGGEDRSAGSLHSAYKELKRNGTKTDIYWQNTETHFILVNKKDEIISFLKSAYL